METTIKQSGGGGANKQNRYSLYETQTD